MRRWSRDRSGTESLFALFLALVGAAVSGVVAAGWANSAVGLPIPTHVINSFAPRQPERALVGATPGPSACAPGQISSSEMFAALRASIGETFGQPLECPRVDPSSGDTLQRTSTGLAIYRAHSHTPTFTDGYHRWAIGPSGMITWQGDALDPPT